MKEVALSDLQVRSILLRLQCSHTALAEKNSMLEAELAQAKEDATTTVAKLPEVEKMCLQLQQNLQRYF